MFEEIVSRLSEVKIVPVVTVFDKDEAVKNNRLALLHAIDALVNKVADFSKIVL